MFLKNWIRQANIAFKRQTPLESESIGWEIGDDGMRPFLKGFPNEDTPPGEEDGEFFAEIQSGSGLTYVVDIYNEFASDMTFTAITALFEDATAKVPDGMLDDTFDLTAGEVYMVKQFTVDGALVWVITTRPGIS